MSFSNVKNLIRKDIALLLHPTVILFFILAGGMLFIPDYPRSVGFFYIVIGIMNIFTLSLQYKDHEASSLFPVQKRESVLARVLLTAAVELAVLVFTVPFTLLAHKLISGLDIANKAGMNLNITLYAIVLIGYGIYNLTVIPAGYTKQFKVYVRSFVGMGLYLIVTVALENLVCRPKGGKLFLNGTSPAELTRQLPFLLGALAVFLIVNAIAYFIASRRYENAEI